MPEILIHRILEQMSKHPNEPQFLPTLAKETQLEPRQVQHALARWLRVNPRQRTIQVDVSGHAWTYIKKARSADSPPLPSVMSLVEDEDYIVQEPTVAIKVANRDVTTDRISQIWLVESGETEFLCNTCKAYHSPNVQSVLAHHGSSHPTGPSDEQIKEAFGLLPIAVAQKLLARVGYVKS